MRFKRHSASRLRLFLLFVLVLVGLFCSGCVSEGSSGVGLEVHPAAGKSGAASAASLEGIPNFAKVCEVLYRGGQPSREGFERLKEMGVKTVVNLRAVHSDREMLRGLELNYLHISFKPWHMEDEDVAAFLKVVSDPRFQPVFVHCAEGVDRTGGMVAAYRMYAQEWPLEDALAEMREMGAHEVWENIEAYLRGLDLERMRKLVEAAPATPVELVWQEEDGKAAAAEEVRCWARVVPV